MVLSGSPTSIDLPEPAQRVVDGDRAAHLAQLFRDQALLSQRLAALRLPAVTPGTCANCVQRCLPMAVYCDAACRADHEQRLHVLEIGGRAR